MQLPKNERAEVGLRTLDNMKKHLHDFQTKGGGDLKKGKFYFNVIHERMLEIPIDQVSITHLTFRQQDIVTIT